MGYRGCYMECDWSPSCEVCGPGGKQAAKAPAAVDARVAKLEAEIKAFKRIRELEQELAKLKEEVEK